ncbi:hypothetical protein KP509_38G020700 [Ceratopteris richardii]|uniref:Phosphoglycerate mutase-like protein AT74H n=1 Tax=Ceratopteris richardii TaxID=49495 RepID=A0A8T2Q2S8_CERRI|nr:hypothetical protein KP509_38G020700 [Ceratopteris richardii]KAH7278035.1 hypothetical protein KP509_38G020700 [Ceratopteris richardii]
MGARQGFGWQFNCKHDTSAMHAHNCFPSTSRRGCCASATRASMHSSGHFCTPHTESLSCLSRSFYQLSASLETNIVRCFHAQKAPSRLSSLHLSSSRPAGFRRKCFKCCAASPSQNFVGYSSDSDVFPDVRDVGVRPPRPKRIILIRHGQSEGNVDESAYTRIPDSQIALTETGWKQALRCGQAVREMIEKDGEDDWSVYFYVSPYKRTLQTLRGIGRAFDRNRIAGVREEPRLREQDFGNFQIREKMLKQKEQRARYGRFFYRFPNGESAADVYDRLTGFRETLRADIDLGRFQRPEARSRNMNLVIVSHGLTLRIFLMRWYKWTVRQFEALNNFSNAGMYVMQLGDYGRYSLLVHHTRQELKDFGLTDAMIDDQEWQIHAKIGELNFDWITSGPSFFTHFDKKDEAASHGTVPHDVIKTT